MANEEDKRNALQLAAATLPDIDHKAAAAALKRASDETRSGGGGDYDFLSFSGKSGHYSLGKDRVEPDADAVYIMEPKGTTRGWICWKDGKVVERHEWAVFDPNAAVVRADELRDHGPYDPDSSDGWSPTIGIAMIDIDRPERAIMFSTNSKSGRNSFSDLLADVANVIADGEDGVAVMTLGAETFTTSGKVNYKPVFNVQAYVSRDEVKAFLADDSISLEDLIDGRILAAPAGDEEEEEEAEEAAPKRSAAKKSAAPSGRRRRAAA